MPDVLWRLADQMQYEEIGMGYVVMVEDNSHFMDAESRSRLGEFAEADTAMAQCRRIVDEFLRSNHRPGMSAEDLNDSYVMFGEDAYICCVDTPAVIFSAWDYAREQSDLLCRDGREATR